MNERGGRVVVTGRGDLLQAVASVLARNEIVMSDLLHVYAKLDVRDRASAVAEAYRRGLLS